MCLSSNLESGGFIVFGGLIKDMFISSSLKWIKFSSVNSYSIDQVVLTFDAKSKLNYIKTVEFDTKVPYLYVPEIVLL